MNYFCGVDIGQSADYTAVTIARRFEQWLPVHDSKGRQRSVTMYHIQHLQRFPLGMAYPEQIRRVRALVERPEVKGQVALSLDVTGVGKPIYDAFVEAKLPCPVSGVLIHGGTAVHREGMIWHVPKRDLVGTTLLLLQGARLKISDRLPDAKILVQELLNFRMKISATTAHDTYNAREGAHDDLLLSACIACWTAEHGPKPMGVTLLNGY